MKSISNLFSVIALTIGLSAVATAQEKFDIAGGGGAKNGSTYSTMLGEFSGACSTDDFQINEVGTNGGVQNLNLLLTNKVKAAIVPTDLLFAAKQDNASSVAQIKVLFPMHPEQVHLIVRGDAKTEGGFNVMGKNFGGNTVMYNNPEDLKGRQVGAVGGSAVSARILSDLLRMGWVVNDTYKSNVELLAALTKHEVDGVVMVAGAPSDAVAKIAGNFKLLTLRGNADTGAVYTASKVQYPNLNNNRAVDTLASPALMVTRSWKSDEMIAKLAGLRSCFYKNLPKIQDQTGTHPAWQSVLELDQAKWPLYELPKVGGQAAPAKKGK